ncbi:MAG TPA: hypothetical protein VH643_04845 [Gemmataceae bacterium]|jgi:hypothetical protein
MRRTFTALLCPLLLAVAAGADETKDKDKPKPPVTAKLIANKGTYTLDIDGMTPEQFRAALKDAETSGKYPKPPAVDLTLELTNTSDKEVQIWQNGDPVQLRLELKGKGAVNARPRRAFTREFRVPHAVTLAPGKSHTIAVKSLQFGFRGVAEQAYWTDAGEYTLTAHFQTGISPPPPDSKAGRDGFARITLTSEPIKIKVEAK